MAGHQIVGDYSDPGKLRELAESCDIVTFELEDIDTGTLIALEAEGHRIYRGRRCSPPFRTNTARRCSCAMPGFRPPSSSICQNLMRGPAPHSDIRWCRRRGAVVMTDVAWW